MTMRQNARGSVKKNLKMLLLASVAKWSSTIEYSNNAKKKQFCGLKTWSRCRRSVVTYLALSFCCACGRLLYLFEVAVGQRYRRMIGRLDDGLWREDGALRQRDVRVELYVVNGHVAVSEAATHRLKHDLNMDRAHNS